MKKISVLLCILMLFCTACTTTSSPLVICGSQDALDITPFDFPQNLLLCNERSDPYERKDVSAQKNVMIQEDEMTLAYHSTSRKALASEEKDLYLLTKEGEILLKAEYIHDTQKLCGLTYSINNPDTPQMQDEITEANCIRFAEDVLKEVFDLSNCQCTVTTYFKEIRYSTNINGNQEIGTLSGKYEPGFLQAPTLEQGKEILSFERFYDISFIKVLGEFCTTEKAVVRLHSDGRLFYFNCSEIGTFDSKQIAVDSFSELASTFKNSILLAYNGKDHGIESVEVKKITLGKDLDGELYYEVEASVDYGETDSFCLCTKELKVWFCEEDSLKKKEQKLSYSLQKQNISGEEETTLIENSIQDTLTFNETKNSTLKTEIQAETQNTTPKELEPSSNLPQGGPCNS